MDRNREARRSTNMAAPPNGLSSSRRRHRTTSLRDSPDEDGGMEVQEAGRLRDRGLVKKERGDRDRDRERERERERSSRSKRRESRLTVHHRDDGDDVSEESVNDEEEEDDEDAGNGGGLRMLPPLAANSSTSAAAAMTNNHHNQIQNSYSQQLHHRKSFPSNKVFRPAAPPPVWKAPDEMNSVAVPRKARSSSTKRSHEWTYGGAAVGGGGGTELINRQSSASPVRLASSPAPVAPSSPSSSSISVRKKMKANGGGSKPRLPKSSSKSSSSNPEELEIEIAEVLYGLMNQSQAPPKKEAPSNEMKIDSNKSSSDTKSRVSSPISNPPISTSLSTVAPKRKRPRQLPENNPPFSVRNSPASSSVKTDTDHHQLQNHQSPKTDNSSPYLENSSPAGGENGVSSFGFTALPDPSPPLPPPAAKEEVEKDGGKSNVEALTTTAAPSAPNNLKAFTAETETQKQEKFEIDLMAPPPQRTSQETDGEIDGSNLKQMLTKETGKSKEDDKRTVSTEEQKAKAGAIQETLVSLKQAVTVNEERNTELRLDFEKLNKDNSSSMASVSSNKSLHQALKHQQLTTKSETHTAQPSSSQIPMSLPGWPPMGYVAPLPGVISMDGNTMPSTPIQPLITEPRPKRCATHRYIAKNIHYLQQFMKMNPFWQAASGPAAPMFSTKHGTPNVIPSIEPQSVQDKGQPVGIFPGVTTGKDTKPSQATTVPDSAHRKQPVLLQQAMQPVPPNNIIRGPAFIFPFNQQQGVALSVATASARPGSSKLSNSTMAGGTSSTAGSAGVGSSTAGAAATALSFSYPNMGANEPQYLAILQNHPYTSFPIPAAVGAPPNYRGNHPHPQTMPLFNGSFYPSQMIHPSQVSQLPQPPQQAPPPAQSQQTHQNSSGSTSSSHKHLQSQQRQQGSGAPAANGGGSGGSNINNYPAAHKGRSQQLSQPMNPPAQARHLENEVVGGEDSPSTADSRFSRAAMSTLGQSLNFAMMYPPAVTANANSNDKKPHQQTHHQQQGLKSNSNDKSFAMMYPQTAAMSFAPMNGTSMAQNHAIFQSLPESVRQSYHHMMTSSAGVASVSASASAHHSEQKKDFRMSEEPSRTTGHDSSIGEEDRKGSAGLAGAKSGQSIVFSRPDLATDASPSTGAINLGSNNRSTRSPMPTTVPAAAQSSQHLHAQIQQQQQQQQNHNQNMNARNKNLQPSSNGSAYADQIKAMAAKFPNSLSSFPLQTSTTNSSPVQSPYWKTVRGSTTSQLSTTTSSLKNLHQTHQPQQQSSRSHPQSHTQISFGAAAVTQKPQSTTSQPPSNSGGNNQSPSPPMLVGSPTTSLSSSQPPKNTAVGTQRSSSSILGNPPSSNSTKSQPQQLTHPVQLSKQTIQQQQQQARARAQMMYTHPLMQAQVQSRDHAQVQQHPVGSTAAASGYYLPRKPQQQQQQQQTTHQQSSSSSTAMLSLSPPVTLANTTTSDPAEAIAAATSNLKASQQGILHQSQYGGGGGGPQSSMPAGFPPAAVQAKPTEQKQPAA